MPQIELVDGPVDGWTGDAPLVVAQSWSVCVTVRQGDRFGAARYEKRVANSLTEPAIFFYVGPNGRTAADGIPRAFGDF